MVVKNHDRSQKLTLLKVQVSCLKVPLMKCAAREPTRVRIRAGDVAIALEPPSNSSVQNIFGGFIEEMDFLDQQWLISD